jgi:hypothetical protein
MPTRKAYRKPTLPPTCSKCGAPVEYKTIGGVMVLWNESKDGHKVYDGKCPNCGTFEFKGDRVGPEDGGSRRRTGGEGVLARPHSTSGTCLLSEPPQASPTGTLSKAAPAFNDTVTIPPKPKSKPTPRANRLTILVPLQTWLRVSPGKEPLLGLLEAARAAQQWFQSMYPADAFNGSSGGSGASNVAALRDDLLEAICDVDHAEVPVPVVVRGSRSCSAECPWFRRVDSVLGPRDTCTLFDVWMGLQGASTTTPGARCQKCVKARVIAKERA